MSSYGAPFVLFCSNQLILFLPNITRDKKPGDLEVIYPSKIKSLQTYEVGAPDASFFACEVTVEA
jgi:hypothetical protein